MCEEDKSLEEEDSKKTDEDPFQDLYLSAQKCQYITESRTIFISRHGESEFNVQERIGGNPLLTTRGQQYAKALAKYLNALDLENIEIWTSTLQRAIDTAAHIHGPKYQTSTLDEIKSGSLDSLTYKDIELNYPQEWKSRELDKLNYRYPGGGESYIDCCKRVKPVIQKLLNRDNLVIVAHQAILRCIFGFLLKKSIDRVPQIKIPQHTIIQVTLTGDENQIEFIRMPIDHVEQGITVASQENEETQVVSASPEED